MNIAPNETRIGWIGTGVMGASMAGHVLDAGYSLTLFNRTREKTASLIERGAKWASSPAEVAKVSDVVFTIVGTPADVREVIAGGEGVLSTARNGTVIVDMTTSEPTLAEQIADQTKLKGITSIDAPVSGGDIGAKNGTLSIMIGGDESTVNDLKPLWETMGSKWVYQGGPGSGQHTKMVNQTLVAAGMVGVCEALLYGYRAKLNLEKVLESVSSGAAGSWSLSNLGPRIIAGNFAPGFFIDHFLKDMGIVLAEARRMNLALPGLALAEQLYLAAKAQGHGRDGTHSLMLALAKLSDIQWPK